MLPTYFELVNDTFTLLSGCILTQLISFCFILLFMPESPYFLYLQGNFAQCRHTLEGIMKMNGRSEIKLLFRFQSESE